MTRAATRDHYNLREQARRDYIDAQLVELERLTEQLAAAGDTLRLAKALCVRLQLELAR